MGEKGDETSCPEPRESGGSDGHLLSLTTRISFVGVPVALREEILLNPTRRNAHISCTRNQYLMVQSPKLPADTRKRQQTVIC